MTHAAFIWLVGAALATAPFSVGAQPLPQIKLKAADAKIEAELVGLTSVRELSDGRVLLTDGRDQRFLVANFVTGVVNEIGRKGSGPGEYRMVGFVHALAGDSGILVDLISRRWLLLNGDKIVATLPPDDPTVVATRSAIVGADAFGHVWSVEDTHIRTGSYSLTYTAADSTAVVLWSRATARPDTIAKLRRAVGRTHYEERDANGRITRSGSGGAPFARAEEAALATDGWLAAVRLDPYRVDWRSPGGKWTLGRALPVPRLKFSVRERAAQAKRQALADSAAAQVQMTAEVRAMVAAPRRSADIEVPEYLPVLASLGRPRATLNGEVVILRYPSADFPTPRYDVVTRRGTLRGALILPDGERIIGFGPKSVYIVWKDADDIERLRRHPWP